MVCILVIVGIGSTEDPLWATGILSLTVLFLLTFAATRAGKRAKLRLGLAEGRRGRNAAQIVANLGMAGLALLTPAFDGWGNGGPLGFWESSLPVLLLAPLCEATADTVSSEIGQAFGGRPLLLTTLRRVDPGTDGAITPLGTVSGISAAAIVAAVGMASMTLTLRPTIIAFTAGIAGLFFDSLLGATLERKGWLGNDLVNFSSTLFAALVALTLLLVTHS